MAKIRQRRVTAESSREEPPAEEEDVETAIERDMLRARVAEARLMRAAICREDVNEFAIYVGRDSVTGARIVQEEIHERFQWLADTFDRLIVMSHPESGKTTQLAILRSLHKLGQNPQISIAFLSKTQDNAAKITRAMRDYIAKSEELATVFPELVPGDKWEEDFFTVRRPVISKDPSVQAVGLGGTIQGSRLDILILDDVLDLANTSTPDQRKKVIRQIRTALERLREGGVAIFLTNAWHPEDAAHTFEKEDSAWIIARFPVIDTLTGESSWPAKWPPHRVDKARREMGPLDFARAYLCRARDEGESPFDQDAINAAIARARNDGIELVYELNPEELPEGAWVFSGVDLAVSTGAVAVQRKSHLTAFVTVLLWPDGSRQLLWVEAGRWSSREIRDRFLDHDRRYGPIFIVENNGAQRWILDIAGNQDDIPVDERRTLSIVPFTTGKNKAHPQFGVEGLAVEIGSEKWYLPSECDMPGVVREVRELIQEMLYYIRGAHTGDRLMALWFAREGARRKGHAGRKERKGGVLVIEGDESRRVAEEEREVMEAAERAAARRAAMGLGPMLRHGQTQETGNEAQDGKEAAS